MAGTKFQNLHVVTLAINGPNQLLVLIPSHLHLLYCFLHEDKLKFIFLFLFIVFYTFILNTYFKKNMMEIKLSHVIMFSHFYHLNS